MELDEMGVRKLLWERTHRMGERAAMSRFAAECGVSPAFVGAVIAGKYLPSEKILRVLGLQRVVRFVPVADAGETSASTTRAQEAA